MSLPYAAGSLCSTVEDLYLWDQALYTDTLVSAKSKELIFKPMLNDYAYGWFVKQTKVGNTQDTVAAVAHGGGINGFNTLITRLVDDRHMIVLFNNTGVTKLDEMSRAISGILYDKTYDLQKPPAAALSGKPQCRFAVFGLATKECPLARNQ